MDTHYPYEPPARFLAEETEGEYTKEDLQELEPDISNSWVFLEELYSGGVDDDDLDLVRAAYRAEVRSVDDRVRSILDELETRGMLDETLVIITSDHGECLGESDLRGERSMGHLDSISERLRTVPLIVANPRLDSRRVEKQVPLHWLSELLMDSPNTIFDVDADDKDVLWDDSLVLFELPTNPHHEESYERYDRIPDWFAQREAKTHTVVGLADEWAVADSAGERVAWADGRERSPSDAPPSLISECERSVKALVGGETESKRGMPNDLQQQLEDLGYL